MTQCKTKDKNTCMRKSKESCKSCVKNVLLLMVLGIAMHKYLLSFCLGLELFTGKSLRTSVCFGYILAYCSMSPIGIGIGIVVTKQANKTLTGYPMTPKNAIPEIDI